MKLLLAFLALAGLSLGVYIYADIASQPASVITTTIPEPQVDEVSTVTITRTKDGYDPDVVVITPGTAVEWLNESDTFHWPASDYHPAHKEYRGFDPGRPVARGETWQFTFSRLGEWGFHDHLEPRTKGTIVVENPNAEAFELEEGQILEEVTE